MTVLNQSVGGDGLALGSQLIIRRPRSCTSTAYVWWYSWPLLCLSFSTRFCIACVCRRRDLICAGGRMQSRRVVPRHVGPSPPADRRSRHRGKLRDVSHRQVLAWVMQCRRWSTSVPPRSVRGLQHRRSGCVYITLTTHDVQCPRFSTPTISLRSNDTSTWDTG